MIYYFDHADLTVRREMIGAVYLSESPPVLNLTFSPGELWSSKMDISIIISIFVNFSIDYESYRWCTA